MDKSEHLTNLKLNMTSVIQLSRTSCLSKFCVVGQVSIHLQQAFIMLGWRDSALRKVVGAELTWMHQR